MWAPFCKVSVPDKEKLEDMEIAYIAGPYRAKSILGIIKKHNSS